MSDLDFNIMEAASIGNSVLERLDRIREEDPVFWSTQSKCWFITRHSDVTLAFRGDYPLSADRLELFSFSSIPLEEQPTRIPNLLKYGSQISVNLDPPVHTRIRKLLVRAFSKKVVEQTRPFVQQRVRELLDKVDTANGELEFNEEIARQLPASVVLRLLGLPDENLQHMRFWATAFVGALASSRPAPEMHDEAERATLQMKDIVQEEIRKRVVSPCPDLLSEMIRAKEDNDALTEEELIAAVILIVVAGHDTTSNSMSLIVAALAEHPECWDYMHQHPDKMLNCVNELMRFIAMSMVQPRIVTDTFDWHGKQVRQGDIVMLFQGTANRDPRVYAHPDRIDFQRNNHEVLTFGPGLHHCLGHLLAKMQLCEFFQALVDRYESVELLDRDLHWMPQIAFRGVTDLRVRFRHRQGSE